MEQTASTNPSATAAPKSPRLMSLDALRGFDMFWIIGADALVRGLRSLSDTGVVGTVAEQFEHADWEGFRFYDLIFPMFVFMVGASIVFSLTRTIAEAGRPTAVKRVIRRGILLFIIGILYSGGFNSSWPDMRLLGVLNRIALAYMFTGLLFCFFKPRALVAICASILLGYWALMALVPIRDIKLEKNNLIHLAEEAGDTEKAALLRRERNPSAIQDSPAWAAAREMYLATTNRVTGKFGKGYNVSNHFDFEHLPARKYDIFWDPEGIISTIPSIATCLLGVFAGFLLMNASTADLRKVALLVGLGVAGVIVGNLWGLQFPVIKKIWTSSYVLVAGGFSAVLLGVFYLIVDVWKFRFWCQPFVWIGMNSITIYLAKNIVGDLRGLAARFVGGDIKAFLDSHVAKGLGEMTLTIVSLLLCFWFVRFLYQRKIFLRL